MDDQTTGPPTAGGMLHVVATPIGNLGDLSPRAAELLAEADLVLAEDTRRTGRLLAHVLDGSDRPRPPMLSLHEHNEDGRVAGVVERLAQGQLVVLVSDAGTPAVSDPGRGVIRGCLDAGIEVVAVPGPSAVLAALVASGLAADRFTFEGFLPRKGRSRARRLAELADEPRTMVLFASPHRAGADLADLAEVLGGDRPAAIARELTKLHEEVVRGDLQALAAAAADGLRGEVVLVVEGAPAQAPDALEPEELAALVAAREAEGSPRKQAIADVAEQAGQPKKVVYQAVLDHRAVD